MNPFDLLFVNPLFNLLIAIYKGLAAAAIPGALGFAIILLTIIIRLLVWPLTASQLKSTQKMAALKPHLDRIKAEHGHDKVRHQQEITKIYKEHGVNPLSGCLTAILQAVPFFALYNVLIKIVQVNSGDALAKINERLYLPLLHLKEIPNTDFLGLDLATKPSQWREVGLLILLIPIATGVLQFILSKMMAPTSAKLPVKVDGKQNIEDTMSQVQSQMVLFIPATLAYVAYTFPLGLSLYLNTFTVIGIVQQYLIAGPGGLSKYLPEKWRK
ncbi:MAG: YidC/Oxa1 family membrane protein insertase [Patescibacteria group bacterium]